jgi:hypothetical protein
MEGFGMAEVNSGWDRLPRMDVACEKLNFKDFRNF